MTKQIYLAGGMSGLTWEEADRWRRDFASLVPDFRCLSPMRCKREKLIKNKNEDKLGPTIEEEPLLSRRGIFVRDHFDCTRCDLVVVNLSNQDNGKEIVSIGTIFELAWAWQNRTPTVLILGEEKNVHNHPFILEAADFKVTGIEEAAEVVRAIL